MFFFILIPLAQVKQWNRGVKGVVPRWCLVPPGPALCCASLCLDRAALHSPALNPLKPVRISGAIIVQGLRYCPDSRRIRGGLGCRAQLRRCGPMPKVRCCLLRHQHVAVDKCPLFCVPSPLPSPAFEASEPEVPADLQPTQTAGG